MFFSIFIIIITVNIYYPTAQINNREREKKIKIWYTAESIKKKTIKNILGFYQNAPVKDHENVERSWKTTFFLKIHI